MPLSRADLDAIRRIVREEIERGLMLQRQRTDEQIGSDRDSASGLPSNQIHALEESARAMVAMLRGDPGTAARHRKAEAYYRATYDESYQRRARKLLGKGDDEPISVEEMAQAIEHWESLRKKRAPKSK